MYLFFYPTYFSKYFIWKKIEDDAKFMLSSAPISYFGYNFLLKILIDSRLVFFERKFNSIQLFQK